MKTRVFKFYIALSISMASGFVFAQQVGAGQISGNEFNPAISLILDGRYTDRDEGDLTLPGFQLGGEAGFPEQGFSTGHNELVISSNVDDKFYGYLTAALVDEEGETVIELEEAFIETLGLGKGFTLKAGKLYSGVGYLNAIHDHAHDFTDRPLVYDALMGGHLVDTGMQVKWVAPTDFYLSFGAEVLSGNSYPGDENDGNNKGKSIFVKTGGDWSNSSSWLLGVSFYETEFRVRESGGHAHGNAGSGDVDNELLDGEVDIAGIDFVYKWAPGGNIKSKNFKFQAEYFIRNESADAEFIEGLNEAEAAYNGKQKGFYAQAVYQFIPAWRASVRYDLLTADNTISDFVDNGIDEDEFLEESSLGTEDDPERYSLMFDYTPTHFSRIRLQYSQLENGHDEKNDMVSLQYVMSLGSHGAHTF